MLMWVRRSSSFPPPLTKYRTPPDVKTCPYITHLKITYSPSPKERIERMIGKLGLARLVRRPVRGGGFWGL